MNVDIVYSVNPKSASQETAVIVQSLACWCKCAILAFFLLFKHNIWEIWVIWTKHVHHQSKISLYFPLIFSHKLVFNVLDYHLSGFEINDFTVREGSSTSSMPPCLSTVKQWIITSPPPYPSLVLLYSIPSMSLFTIFPFSPAGINQPITFCSVKFFMSMRRCSMFWNNSATDSINQYYHSNVERAPLTPHTPLWPVEEKGNYAGSAWEQEKSERTPKSLH